MNFWRKLRHRLHALFQKQKLNAEIAEEMRSHIEMRARENIDAGMKPEEARYAALRQFGWVESIKELCREQRGLSWIENLGQDIRYGARMLRKNPGFTAVAVLTLALGIGANTVVFSVVKAVLFRPLGIEQPDRLVWIRLSTPTANIEERMSAREFERIREAATSFEVLAAFGSPGALWEQDDGTEELRALGVTPSLAQVLRVRPALGRTFLPSDTDGVANNVALISHELWQARFRGSPDIIGQTLRLNEQVRTVIGVLPEGLEFPLQRAPSTGTGISLKPGVQDVWLPQRVESDGPESGRDRMFLVIGRLKPGVTVERARAELAALGQRLAVDHPDTNRGWSFEPLAFRDQVLGRTQRGIQVLAVAVAAVLLVCCINLGNLLLARGAMRQRELAVRVALGAGRGRVVRGLLTECVILSLLGGGAGMALTIVAVHVIRTLSPAAVPFIKETTINGPVMLFTVGLSIVTALVFGLFPAFRQSRVKGSDALRSGTRTSAGPELRAWQRGLLVGQLAVVLVLLTSAGLLLESFRRLMNLDLGYRPKPVIVFDFSTPSLPTNADGVRMYRELRTRLAALPGVEAVGTISSTPLTGQWTFDVRAQPLGRGLPEAEQPSLAATFIAFDYFQAMGIPLLAGRFFRDGELREQGPAPVLIINESAAAKLFRGQMAVGNRVVLGNDLEQVPEIIGVVKDTRDVRLEEKPQPRLYWLYPSGGSQVVVRSTTPASVMIPLLRDTMNQFRARTFIREIKPMGEIVSATVAERRFLMAMLTAYASVALGIAAVGIFGVVGYQVSQRTNEFGIRLALGASARSIKGLVLTQASQMVAVGLAIGLLLSLGAARLLSSQLFGLSPHDPILLTVVNLLLLGVALLASFIPARRASKVDPMVALRYE